uniref:Serine incorporator n=1 Tax=Oryza glaberrima TaxID=4538 RepID=I1NKU2_ORYGL
MMKAAGICSGLAYKARHGQTKTNALIWEFMSLVQRKHTHELSLSGVRSWGSMTLGSGGMAAEEGGGNGEAAARGERCVVVAVEETCCACAQLVVGPPNPMMARYVYAFVFLATNLLAWTLRDFGHPVLAELRRLRGSCQGAGYCLGAEGVLRVSLGCFVSSLQFNSDFSLRFSLHFVREDRAFRSRGVSGDPARQCHPVHHLAERLLPVRDQPEEMVQVVSIAAYVGSILGVVLMYVWYAPRPSCKLNILFITVTLVLVQLMTGVSLSSKVKAGYLAPGLMGVYIVFLCWTAIRSEPHTEICNKKAEVATSADWVNIASFVIAVIVIVTATFATGIDSKCLQFKKAESEQPEDDDIPYGFGFFHFVFAMGAMYFAMLFVGWNANQTMEKWTIDVGWASTWVRVVNEWLAAIVYISSPVTGEGNASNQQSILSNDKLLLNMQKGQQPLEYTQTS